MLTLTIYRIKTKGVTHHKERDMTKEETLAGCREKWATLPTEEEACDWWGNIGQKKCALCKYMEDTRLNDGCGICPFATNKKPCHPAWRELESLCDGYDDWNYSIFKENFLLMQAAVNALTPDDLPDEENDDE
jgi:hypothetical protein